MEIPKCCCGHGVSNSAADFPVKLSFDSSGTGYLMQTSVDYTVVCSLIRLWDDKLTLMGRIYKKWTDPVCFFVSLFTERRCFCRAVNHCGRALTVVPGKILRFGEDNAELLAVEERVSATCHKPSVKLHFGSGNISPCFRTLCFYPGVSVLACYLCVRLDPDSLLMHTWAINQSHMMIVL